MKTLLEGLSSKGKWLLVSFWAILAPIHTTIGIAFALVMADLLLGVWSAKKHGQPITSAGLKRSVLKIVVYELALILGFMTEQYIPGSLPFTNLIGGFISLTEMTSILENLNSITGNSLLSTLVTKLGQSKTPSA